MGIAEGFNRIELPRQARGRLRGAHHQAAPTPGLPNVICFSGNRGGMDDELGLANCAVALKQIVGEAEKRRVTVCMELLNSRVNHPDYMCDHTAWGVELVKRVGSERFKLLYDIYHMQIMEGDVIRHDPGEPQLHRPLPHRRRSRPPRDRRDPGDSTTRP